MKYKAILFDLDGTLLDTLQDIANSVNKGLREFGFPQHDVEAYKDLIGEGRKVLTLRALPENNRDEDTVRKLLDDVNKDYVKHWEDNTHPYVGIPELLDEMTIRDIKLTVLSNKADDLVKMMVSKMLDKWHFEVVIGAKPSLPPKPDPTTALQIAEQLEIAPSEFIYLGDSGIDMRTAVGAGMYPVGALWGFRSADELLTLGAKVLIEQPLELLKHL